MRFTRAELRLWPFLDSSSFPFQMLAWIWTRQCFHFLSRLSPFPRLILRVYGMPRHPLPFCLCPCNPTLPHLSSFLHPSFHPHQRLEASSSITYSPISLSPCLLILLRPYSRYHRILVSTDPDTSPPSLSGIFLLHSSLFVPCSPEEFRAT